MTHLLSHWLGMDNPSGPVYLFLSGAGGILLTWLGSGIVAGLLFWWHNQCYVTGCYWYARRTTAAGERACYRHHPHKRRTERDIHAAHRAAARATESEVR
jgi:hypothetical protein